MRHSGGIDAQVRYCFLVIRNYYYFCVFVCVLYKSGDNVGICL